MEIETTEEDQRKLQALEEELWKAATRFDQAYMEMVFSKDFFEFGRSGQIHTRESCLSHSSGEIAAVLPLKNLRIRLISIDVAQVTYDSEVTYNNIVEKAHRSSIWSRKNNSWELRFHQGTAFE